jgi:hypothetical protein
MGLYELFVAHGSGALRNTLQHTSGAVQVGLTTIVSTKERPYLSGEFWKGIN